MDIKNLKYIEKNILRKELSHRGGGMEIDLTDFGYNDEKMSAYQNYLGGGILGSIQTDSTVEIAGDLMELSENLKEYFFFLQNSDGNLDFDEWAGNDDFENLQKRSASAY